MFNINIDTSRRQVAAKPKVGRGTLNFNVTIVGDTPRETVVRNLTRVDPPRITNFVINFGNELLSLVGLTNLFPAPPPDPGEDFPIFLPPTNNDFNYEIILNKSLPTNMVTSPDFTI